MRLAGVIFACLLLPAPAPAKDTSGEDRISASYRVGVSAIDLGTFDLTATVGRKAYALKANGAFSILAGLVYQSSGETASTGTRVGASAKPQRFDFSYADSKKQQELQILFDQGTVRSVTRKPKKRPDKRAVPLSKDQLRNVLDPMTAAFLSIQSDLPAGDLAVCDQTLRVFDGKQLFELTLSPKRTEALGPGAPGDLQAAAVCTVIYKPVGGHRPENTAVSYLRKSKDIEAWLVPVPGTGIFLPYKVVLPTAWGNGTVTMTKLKAETDAARRASAR